MDVVDDQRLAGRLLTAFAWALVASAASRLLGQTWVFAWVAHAVDVSAFSDDFVQRALDTSYGGWLYGTVLLAAAVGVLRRRLWGLWMARGALAVFLLSRLVFHPIMAYVTAAERDFPMHGLGVHSAAFSPVPQVAVSAFCLWLLFQPSVTAECVRGRQSGE